MHLICVAKLPGFVVGIPLALGKNYASVRRLFPLWSSVQSWYSDTLRAQFADLSAS